MEFRNENVFLDFNGISQKPQVDPWTEYELVSPNFAFERGFFGEKQQTGVHFQVSKS